MPPRRRSRACSTASISMPASRSTSTSARRPGTPAAFSPRWCKRRGIAPAATDMRVGFNPLGRPQLAGGSPLPWSELAPIFNAVDLRTGRPRLSRTVRGGGRAGHPQCRRLGGAGARLRAGGRRAYLRALEAGGVALDAARRMIYFRLAADADQFLTIAKFRALRKLWARVEEACGLAPKPALRRGRDRVAHDDAARSLREHAARDHRGVLGRPRRRRRDHGAAVHRWRSACPTASRGGSRATRSSCCSRKSNLAKVADPAAGSGGHRGPDREALPRGLGAVPGDRAGRRRLGGARSGPDPEASRGGARRSASRRSRGARMR